MRGVALAASAGGSLTLSRRTTIAQSPSSAIPIVISVVTTPGVWWRTSATACWMPMSAVQARATVPGGEHRAHGPQLWGVSLTALLDRADRGAASRLRSHPSNLIRLVPAKGANVHSTRPHDRDLRLRGRRRHPGRPQGVRRRGRARHVGARRADGAEHGRRVGDRGAQPPAFVRAQLDSVFGDIGVDAAKTGMLFSRVLIETVADYLEAHPVPLVVDPVLVASSGARLLEEDAVRRARRTALPARDGRDAEPHGGEGARRGSTRRAASSRSACARSVLRP